MLKRIEELWREHLKTRFPPACRGADVEGIDLVMLDADIAGCIDTYLRRGGDLGTERTAILGLCYRELGTVVLALPAEAREYYQRLETMTEQILRALAARLAS